MQAAHQAFNQPALGDDSAQPVRNNPSLVPLDALRAARRHDLHVARRAAESNGRHRRRARAGAGRLGRSDAALPDQDPHAIGRLDRRQLDVGALGKVRMHRQRPADRVQPRSR